MQNGEWIRMPERTAFSEACHMGCEGLSMHRVVGEGTSAKGLRMHRTVQSLVLKTARLFLLESLQSFSLWGQLDEKKKWKKKEPVWIRWTKWERRPGLLHQKSWHHADVQTVWTGEKGASRTFNKTRSRTQLRRWKRRFLCNWKRLTSKPTTPCGLFSIPGSSAGMENVYTCTDWWWRWRRNVSFSLSASLSLFSALTLSSHAHLWSLKLSFYTCTQPISARGSGWRKLEQDKRRTCTHVPLITIRGEDWSKCSEDGHLCFEQRSFLPPVSRVRKIEHPTWASWCHLKLLQIWKN